MAKFKKWLVGGDNWLEETENGPERCALFTGECYPFIWLTQDVWHREHGRWSITMGRGAEEDGYCFGGMHLKDFDMETMETILRAVDVAAWLGECKGREHGKKTQQALIRKELGIPEYR